MRIVGSLFLGLVLVACAESADVVGTSAGADSGTGGVAGGGGTAGAGGAGATGGTGGQVVECPDRDNDGAEDAACNANVARGGGDCDDENNSVHPNRDENCANLVDNDCNGHAPDTDPACGGGCVDLDGDGFQDAACNLDPLTGGDCDDQNPDVNPGAEERCGNFRDDDCWGGDLPCLPNCIDEDRDGFGEGSGCFGPDCDDTERMINPWMNEICDDGVDSDCSGRDLACPADCVDLDKDGFGVGLGCINVDCNDTDPNVNFGARDVPDDGIDQDCDGISLTFCQAEGQADCIRGCDDRDRDGYGQGACLGEDCDDSNPRIHGGRVELCGNGLDDDCDGADRTCVHVEDGECVDLDGDGHGSGACRNSSFDCDDDDPAVNPFAAELCNGRDDNCNDEIDECVLRNQACGDPDGDGRDECVGDANAPCGGDQQCGEALVCEESLGECRVEDGADCEESTECRPGAECLLLDVCGPTQACYQAKGGACDEHCDCTGMLLCDDAEGRCVECLGDQQCDGARDTCTAGGQCASLALIGGPGVDARDQLLHQLAACWATWAYSPEMQACNIDLFEDVLEVGGQDVGRIVDLDAQYDDGYACDEGALSANGFSGDEIEMLDEIFGSCGGSVLNRINVWWQQDLLPGSEWCVYFAPAKSGFGFPQDTRQAVVVDSCGLSDID